MFKIERLDKILRYINENNKAGIDEISDKFGVSKVTVRRDLEILSNKGLVIKTHGGVMSIENKFSYEIPYSNKSETNSAAKRAIGIAAAKLVDDGDLIILDSGSTTLEVAKNIRGNNLTILTNDIKVSNEIAHRNGIRLILSGGILGETVYSMTGIQTLNFFKQFHINRTFLGCDAIDLSLGISNRTLEEVEIKKAMIDAAEEVILVTDSSKLNKKVFCHVCDFSKVNKLVIDSIDDSYSRILQQYGVEVIIAKQQ